MYRACARRGYLNAETSSRVADPSILNLVVQRFLAVGREYSCSLWKIDMVKAMDCREFNNVPLLAQDDRPVRILVIP